jgi:predicted ArsR family transcriptional regulator
VSTPRTGTAAGASRALVLAALRSHGRPMAVGTVADAVGLSVNTVRFHLDRLCREGSVARERTRPDGPGRPHLAYRAVAPEAVDDGAAYRLLAELLAEGLGRSGNTRATAEAGRSWADRLIQAHDPRVGVGGGPRVGVSGGPCVGVGGGVDENVAAVARVVELFEDGGFAPELLADAATVALHRCPFMDLARVRADVVCTVHLACVRGVLHRLRQVAEAAGRIPHQIDADLVRLMPVTDGSGPCLLTLPVPRVDPSPG